MDSERYRLTVLFLKTFFRSWALSVKLHINTPERDTHTHTRPHTSTYSQPVYYEHAESHRLI